jgi:hypothetical protein
MKKLLLLAAIAISFTFCNNSNEGAATTDDPTKVHPESEAIPDSMKIVNDSAVVPDAAPGNASTGTSGDSAR